MSLQPIIKSPNDKRAKIIITILSVVVFGVVVALDGIKEPPAFPFDFDVHYLAAANAIINTIVSILLVAGLITAKKKQLVLHKKIMLTAIVFSIFFLVFYIGHHLFAGSTSHGGSGMVYVCYLILLITHIFLAAGVLPFILSTAYRAATGEYAKHRKIAKITWPLWFYVAVSGVVVYLMIQPYY
jgi:putative membrane protein